MNGEQGLSGRTAFEGGKVPPPGFGGEQKTVPLPSQHEDPSGVDGVCLYMRACTCACVWG